MELDRPANLATFAFKHCARKAIGFPWGRRSLQALAHEMPLLDGACFLRSKSELACLLDLASDRDAHR